MRRTTCLPMLIVLAIIFIPGLNLALAQEAEPQVVTGSGYWHTSGNLILDKNGNRLKVAGVNWYGFETTNFVANGLWAKPYRTIIDEATQYGYNAVRIPFSNQMVETNPIPSSGLLAANPDLQGLHSLQILDRIVDYAGQIGLKVLLDNHRSEAGNGAEDNGLWYTTAYPESAWIADWQALTTRYKGNSTVVAFDLRDEPHTPANLMAQGPGADWGSGSLTTDWRLAAERAGNAILSVNSDLLILVEGVSRFPNGTGGFDYTWWGGNLEGVKDFPVRLNLSGRLVYSPHDYGPDLFRQGWFNSSTSYESLVAVWTKYWAYINIFPANDSRLAPIWIGEFGTTNAEQDISDSTSGSQGQWFSSLLRFIETTGNIHWTYWALNGEDRYGLLATDYSDVALQFKQLHLSSVQTGRYLPVVLNDAYGGFTTGINIANRNDQAAPASLTFFDNSGRQVKIQKLTIPAHGAVGLYQGDGRFPSGFIGSAIVQSPLYLSVIVNETGPNGAAMSYESWTSGFKTLDLPIVLNDAYGGFVTGFTLQNPQGSQAMGTVTYYDTGGHLTAKTNFSIGPHGSQGFYQGGGALPKGFAGSAIVDSSAALSVVVNETGPGEADMSYGQGIPNQHFGFPVILKNAYGGITTGVNLHNPGPTAATATLSYYSLAGALVMKETVGIPAKGSAGLYQGSSSLPDSFVGSVFIDSNVPLSGVVNEIGSGRVAISYGKPFQLAPRYPAVILNDAYGGFTTGFTLVNSSALAVNVSIDFFNVSGGKVASVPNFALGAHSGRAFYQGDGTLPAGFVGSAVVSSSAGLEMEVNEVGPGGQGMGYSGLRQSE